MIVAILSLFLSACPTEDSRNCLWDASRGNGAGRSFVDVAGTAYYLN